MAKLDPKVRAFVTAGWSLADVVILICLAATLATIVAFGWSLPPHTPTP